MNPIMQTLLGEVSTAGLWVESVACYIYSALVVAMMLATPWAVAKLVRE